MLPIHYDMSQVLDKGNQEIAEIEDMDLEECESVVGPLDVNEVLENK